MTGAQRAASQRERHKPLRTRLYVTYTPTGGTANNESAHLTLNKINP